MIFRNKHQGLLILVLIISFLAGCSKIGGPSTEVSSSSAGINYTGYGANQCVSGSLHVLEIDGEKIILDAGLFYGQDGQDAPPLEKSLIENVSAIIITHAHLDHVGRLFQLLLLGYQGPIYCTAPTRDLMPVMLTMEARYGDFGPEEFYYSIKSKTRNKNSSYNTAVHLYPCESGKNITAKNKRTIKTRRSELDQQGFYYCKNCADLDVEKVIKQVQILPLDTESQITRQLTVKFLPTPHIPGSVMAFINSSKSGKTVLYTGDFGSGTSRFLAAQSAPQKADFAIVEGTYGINGNNDPLTNEAERREFQEYIGNCIRKNQRVIIPAFVLDRSQQILGEISRGMDSGLIPPVPVKVFSPSTAEINYLYKEIFTDSGYRPFFSDDYQTSGPFKDIYREYSRIEDVAYGEIALASSGMADSVYSREFVNKWLDDPQTAFVFVGYQDPESVGGMVTVAQQGSRVKIDNKWHDVRAKIKKFGCFSSHGSYEQISEYLKGTQGLQKVILVHSDFAPAKELQEKYHQDFPQIQFFLPASGETVELY